MNVKKPKVLAYSQNEEVEIMTTDGSQLEVVYDFNYLGSWIDNTEVDLRSRKAKANRACNKLTKAWEIKVRLLGSAVESILLFGSDAWTLTEKKAHSL